MVAEYGLKCVVEGEGTDFRDQLFHDVNMNLISFKMQKDTA